MSNLHELLQNALDIRMMDESRFTEIRRQVFDDGKVNTEEANLVFEIDSEIADLPEGWNEFFVGALTDFIIRQTLPVGYVDPIHASWLMERLEHDNRLSEDTELELLLNILRLAREVPESLELYTLEKIRDKIVGRAVEGQLSITDKDVENLKRVLYACGGNGGYSISKAEAQFLFDLDEISQNKENAIGWKKLFVGSIANHLMTIGAPTPLDREKARRNDEFLMSTETISWNLKRSFNAWLEQFQNGDSGTIKSQFLDEERLDKAQTITFAEADWLVDHINRDGTLSDNEQALLAFIEEECPSIHESLRPLLRYAA